GGYRTNDIVAAPTVIDSDADGDSISHSYQWQKNEIGRASGRERENGSTLDLSKAGNGNKGDQVRVVVTATAAGATDSRASNALTVADAARVIASVTVAGTYRTNDTVAAPAVIDSDADGDSIIHSYQWQKN